MDNQTILHLLPAGLPPPIAPDRGGYTVTMRESSGAEDVLDRLSARDPKALPVHVGWGSFRNLDIAAIRRSAGVVLLDINLHQFRVWDAVGAALGDPACVDAKAFVDRVVPLLPHRPQLRQFMSSTEDWLLADCERPGSWLCADRPERFSHIRSLFRDGKVVTGCIDMRATGCAGIFATLRERMDAVARQERIAFDTLYVSNLPWMLAQEEDFFGEEIGLPAEVIVGASLRRARENLSVIAGCFRHVISAGRLAQSSSPSDYQWQTELLAPAAFLDLGYWSELVPVSGQFRNLR